MRRTATHNERNAAGAIGRTIEELPTPCLLADCNAMTRNLQTLQRFLQLKGKSLRAHAKTHKSSQIASLQLKNGAIGICVAKLSEAEALIKSGITNLLVTGPVVTDEAHDRLIGCLDTAPELLITLDNLDNARRLAKKAPSFGEPLHCLIDLDPGFHRTGVPLSEAIAFAQNLAEIPQLRIRGIQSYAGDLQHIVSWEERSARTKLALAPVVDIFREYRSLGLNMDIFSVGGTGTVQFDAEIPEVTEIQAGSYVFMDAEYGGLEWKDFLDRPGTFETSLCLLSTVVTANHPGFATIDAGLKALYRDGATPTVIEPLPFPTAMTYDWLGDEYGKITAARPDHHFTVGEKIQLTVSHLDPTINLFDYMYLTDAGRVVDVIPIDLRGCSQ